MEIQYYPYSVYQHKKLHKREYSFNRIGLEDEISDLEKKLSELKDDLERKSSHKRMEEMHPPKNYVGRYFLHYHIYSRGQVFYRIDSHVKGEVYAGVVLEMHENQRPGCSVIYRTNRIESLGFDTKCPIGWYLWIPITEEYFKHALLSTCGFVDMKDFKGPKYLPNPDTGKQYYFDTEG